MELAELTADMIHAVEITEAPRHNYASGYGSKIPTRYLVRIGNRWHRVYVVQYGNSGSSYVLIKGVRHYLDTYAEGMLQDAAK